MKRGTGRTQVAESVPNDSAPSLRQRLRLLGRDAILEAACDLFLHRGYRATTMAAVAQSAGVGVATVFRYFKTKEGILAALSRRDTDKISRRAREAMKPPQGEPAEAILRVLQIVLETHEMPSTKIRGQTRLWLLLPTGHAETDEVVTASDRELQELILEILQHYRRAGRIRKDLDLHDMTIAIFAVFYHHYLKIGLDKSVEVEQVRAEITRRVPLLFTAWTTETATSPSQARTPDARSRGRN